MKISNIIELNLKMHTERRNHTLSQAEMRDHTFILKKQKEEQAFEDMIEEFFLEEEKFNSLIEERILEDALRVEMFNSLNEDRIQEYDLLYDAIEGFEYEDCCDDADWDDYSDVEEWVPDAVLLDQHCEDEDFEDSSCCFEIGYNNDENSSGIFGSYVGIYSPKYAYPFK